MPKKVDKKKIKKPIPPRPAKPPIPPISGYIRFMKERHAQLSFKIPNFRYNEHIQTLTSQWKELPSHKKRMYLKATEEERVKYDEDLAKYKKTVAAYKCYMKKKLEKQKNNTSFQKMYPKASEEHVKYDKELAEHKKTDAYKYNMKKRLEQQKKNTSFQKYQELKKMVSTGKQLKKDPEFKKEKESTPKQFKKDQEIKRVQTSKKNKFKKVQELNKENTSDKNSNAVHDIPIFTEEFLNFNKARETDLRNLRKNVKIEEQKICVTEKHNEKLQNAITNIKANTKKLDAGYSKYKKHLNILRSQLLEKLAYIESKSDAVPFSNKTIDKYMVDLSKQLTNYSVSKDVWIIDCIKNAFPNSDSS